MTLYDVLSWFFFFPTCKACLVCVQSHFSTEVYFPKDYSFSDMASVPACCKELETLVNNWLKWDKVIKLTVIQFH